VGQAATVGTKLRLGEISVGKLLGKGGFGVVHEAAIAGIDFRFAIKLLNPSAFNQHGDANRARFFREAEVLLKLRHPHIIAIYGVGEHEGTPFILMERFAGLDLVKARELGVPSPDLVLPFVEYVAGALGHAHRHNVVHRDIKPSNLMSVRGDARVLDFGIAAMMDPDGSRLTQTGATCVGDAYSAPELAEDPRLVDPRCDVYSVGACWFWLLTGRAPKGLNWEAALRSATKVSPQYEKVVLRCLDQAASRYATMDELAADVRALREGESIQVRATDLSDEDVLVLGSIASACSSPGTSTSFYSIEQELRGSLSRLSLGIVNRRLLRQELVMVTEQEDHNGVHEALHLAPLGERWVEQHQARVAEVMRLAQPPKAAEPAGDDDIPF
jgi:serine/threonine protein kinase